MYGQLMRVRVVIAAAVALAAALTVMILTTGESRDADSARNGSAATTVDLPERVREFAAGIAERRVHRDPTRAERGALADGVGLLLAGERERAEQRLREVDYAVSELKDRESGRSCLEVADAREEADGSGTRGWGRVYLDLDRAPAWTVQVPHPVADLDTELLGAQVLRGTPGGVLILAGAHRDAGGPDAADVAHRTDTVFHRIVRETVRRGLPGVQLHGFADDSVPEFDALVSSGSGDHGEKAAKSLVADLSRQGFAVCRAWSQKCRLEGRTNEQGIVAERYEVPFVHVEFNRDSRRDPALRSRIVSALGGVVQQWR
ncbi:hypothetical protein MTQ01_05935 [Streptomyces sp. XM4193]|uniref:hypothetical protein n=1 Tax=Streptomyces sp. XM4193 TaxID=2929782 RepID=UPI001FF8B4DE|nr:hypothetical protein [Streptomyces sp. XM4193]MCK1795554.1 hypothetical protein [Streptomyces sp. XM4193]